jgi:site-specific recombinase XerD
MAAEQGIITNETRAAIEGIRGVRGTRQPAGRDVDAGEIAALMRVCESDNTPAGARDAAMIALMRASGMRRAEVCALKLADVDVERGELRVIGKGNKERAVFVANGAQRALRDWLDVRGDVGEFVFCQIGKGAHVRPHEGLTPQAINIALAKRIAQAGIEGATPHDFRRTLAGDLLDNGSDIATVAKLLGHSSVTTTQRYDRRDNRAIQRAAASVSVPYRGRRI